MSLFMLPLELAGSTNDRKKQGKQGHKYKRLPSIYILLLLYFQENKFSPLNGVLTASHTTLGEWYNVINSCHLVWLPRQALLFCFCFVGFFFLRNSHLIGFILTEQTYITKSSCILLVYISYTIFNLNFQVVISLWLEKK